MHVHEIVHELLRKPPIAHVLTLDIKTFTSPANAVNGFRKI